MWGELVLDFRSIVTTKILDVHYAGHPAIVTALPLLYPINCAAFELHQCDLCHCSVLITTFVEKFHFRGTQINSDILRNPSKRGTFPQPNICLNFFKCVH